MGVAELLRRCKSLEYLDIRWNSIDDAGTKLICDAILENPGLKYLNLRENHITPVGATHVARLLTYSTSIYSRVCVCVRSKKCWLSYRLSTDMLSGVYSFDVYASVWY